MSIAVSGASPSSVQSATTAATSASFTPDAGSLIVAIVTVGNSTGSGATTGTVTDSLGSTWTMVKRSNLAGSACSEVWMMDAGGSPSARTVTATGTVTNGKGVILTVKVLTGALATASQTGATASATGTATSLSITTTTAGSQVVGAIAHSEANVALVANGITTIYSNFADSTNGSSYCTLGATSLTGTPGATTIGLTTATSSAYIIALVEVLPQSGTPVNTTDALSISISETSSLSTIDAIDQLGLAISASKPFLYSSGNSFDDFSMRSGSFVTNAGAETGSPPTGWAAITNCTLAMNATFVNEGIHSVKVTATASGDAVFRTPISSFPLNNNQYHHFIISTFTSATSKLCVGKINYYDSSSAFISSSLSQSSFSSGSWTDIYNNGLQISNSSVANACIQVTISSADAGADYYFDTAIIGYGYFPPLKSTATPDMSGTGRQGPFRSDIQMTNIPSGSQYGLNGGGDLYDFQDWTIEQTFATTDTSFTNKHYIWQNHFNSQYTHFLRMVSIDGTTSATQGRISAGFKNTGSEVASITATAVVNDGNIHHAVLTISSSPLHEMYLWLDGVRHGPLNTKRTSYIASNQHALFSTLGSDSFNGYIGHHAQYRRILTDDEIMNHAALATIEPNNGEPGILSYQGYVDAQTAKVWDGSTWNTNGVKVYDGSNWI